MKLTKNLLNKSLGLIIMLATLVACSSISVRKDWDPSVDFSQFKTFYILEEQRQSISRFADQRINAAIVANLTSKGLQQVDSQEGADIAIGYTVTTENRSSFQTVHTGWATSGYHHNRYSRGWHSGVAVTSSRTHETTYTVGTLVVAVFQMGDKELIWEASGSDTINPSRDPARNEQRINEAVQRIMRDFPPR